MSQRSSKIRYTSTGRNMDGMGWMDVFDCVAMRRQYSHCRRQCWGPCSYWLLILEESREPITPTTRMQNRGWRLTRTGRSSVR